MLRISTVIMFMLTIAMGMNAKIRLASLLTDNMVLQQNADVKLTGYATPGAQVVLTPSWSRQIVNVKADGTGRWEAKVRTLKASYDSHDLTISEGKERVTLHNILFGEVWLASGQSNMEMPLEGFAGCNTKNGTHDAMMASQVSPYVRMFTVKKSQTMTPQPFCEGTWQTTEFPAPLKFSAAAYYFASALSLALRCPVGIVNASYGGAHVESWMPKEILDTYDDIPTDSVGVYSFGAYDFDRPMLMYNAMFHPVKDYTYRGIIWYQGCSNIGHADVYPERLAAMVSHWRKVIGCGEIPFYEVEIAPYDYGNDTGAYLREAQMKATEIIPNSGIVGTSDAVEPYERWNIHPSRKTVVGDRLAFMALNRTYGMKEVVCDAPTADKSSFRLLSASELPAGVFTSQNLEGRRVAAIDLRANNDMGICRTYDLSGFELAGEDRVFHPCQAQFRWQTNTVFLTSQDVPEPIAIRYCFKDWQPGGVLGGNELPLFPFRTDEW